MAPSNGIIKKLGICQVEKVTTAHIWLGMASLFGVMFVITHLVTICVTALETGWEMQHLMIDLSGFLGGALFTCFCIKSSSQEAQSRRDQTNVWIFFWSAITCCVRVLDTSMLLGLIHVSALYEEPTGAVFIVNLVSEIIFGNLFALSALTGSTMFLCSKKEKETFDESLLV